MEYENRLVFFLDIIGFKDIIEETTKPTPKSKELIKKLYSVFDKDIEDILSPRGDEPSNNLRSRQVTHFSDSIVVSMKVRNQVDLTWVVRKFASLLYNVLDKGILFRGGSAYGKLIHTQNVLFGPAFVKAYELQEKAAIYPRVLISKEIFENLSKDISTDTQISFDSFLCELKEYVSKDYDGLYYIDYFRESFNCGSIEPLRDIITSGLERDEPDLQIKYGWMKQKFNELVDEFNVKGHNYPRINLST